MLRLSASDLGLLLIPEPCPRRVYLHHQGRPAAPAGPFEQLLQKLGDRHEQRLVTPYPHLINLAAYASSARLKKTAASLASGHGPLYHPLFKAQAELAGQRCEIWGEPDFILTGENGPVICDAKLARDPSKHPAIALQLQLYGWLFRQTMGRAPHGLTVYAGTGVLNPVEDDAGLGALEKLEEVVRLRQMKAEPYSPVGWTKCTACGYFDHCWEQARRRLDVAMVPKVGQGLAKALHEEGLDSLPRFLAHFDEPRLREYPKYHGQGRQRVGKDAGSILLLAQAMSTGEAIWIRKPEVPPSEVRVFFDLEGLPPQLDDLDKIYLWGMLVDGADGGYQAAVSEVGPEGDRQGWLDFLERAQGVFARYGDLPWFHWHSYEARYLRVYQQRYGDPDGIAQRVLDHLFDLLPETRESVALPLPSYGLKTVEKYVGYRRRLAEGNGDWSMAKYIEAVETEDPVERQNLLREILDYNREDLEATRAVFQWLNAKH